MSHGITNRQLLILSQTEEHKCIIIFFVISLPDCLMPAYITSQKIDLKHDMMTCDSFSEVFGQLRSPCK